MTRPAVPPPTTTCRVPQFPSYPVRDRTYVVKRFVRKSSGVGDSVGAFEDATTLPILAAMRGSQGDLSDGEEGESDGYAGAASSCHLVRVLGRWKSSGSASGKAGELGKEATGRCGPCGLLLRSSETGVPAMARDQALWWCCCLREDGRRKSKRRASARSELRNTRLSCLQFQLRIEPNLADLGHRRRRLGPNSVLTPPQRSRRLQKVRKKE